MRINFYFKNVVAKTTINPVLHTGTYTLGPIYGHFPQNDGTAKDIETIPTDSALARQFSFSIPQYIYSKETLNKNIALLTCEKWPENTTLFGTISVDLSRQPRPIVEVDCTPPVRQLRLG